MQHVEDRGAFKFRAQLLKDLLHDHRYHMDPSGTFVQCDARAIGSASEGAQSSLQEVYHKV